jgi:phosphoribosylformimino-5-aminoimidazole carboxamide ribotide isomerase
VELIPAIDLRAGRVVRLRQGDFGREQVHGDDPLAMVRHWVGEGAPRLHLVDLDGAREGRPVQADLLAELVRAAGIPCQVAGGLRDNRAVAAALETGGDRVVLGTRLINDPAWARGLIARHGAERIVAALDVKGDEARGDGWVSGGARRHLEVLLGELREAGVALFVVTAISRDGLLSGPDLELLERVAAVVGPAAVIASGGIASLADLEKLAIAGYAGAILGSALYEEKISLADALRELRSGTEGDH